VLAVAGAEAVKVGILVDHPAAGRDSTRVLKVAVADVAATGRLDRPITFVVEEGLGLPNGTAAAVERAFARLVEQDVLAILGPSITDNGLVARDLADAARVPCINWTGADTTRSEWMFHYQVGSLEEEPHVLARHLHALGHRRVALVQDRTPIGQRYGSFFEVATDGLGIEVVARAGISPVAEDLTDVVDRLRTQAVDALVYLGLGLSAHALAVAKGAAAWPVPVFTNSALMFGYLNESWREGWEGWTYVDAWSEDNPLLQELLTRFDDAAASPISLVSGYDLGRLIAEAVAGAEQLTRVGIKDALERIKLLPAALGTAGTTMGFGQWERSALKGGFLVLRQWKGGESVRV
jgi:branched-chain amino acid transport system substrate-binding protein